MGKTGKCLNLLALIGLGLVFSLSLPGQRVWSEVKLDRSAAYVGQPVEVRITVYTSTWFTRGLDLGNIKVNGAFSVYFRPVSQSFQFEGKTYAGVQQIYHVFPYRAEDIVFPSLEIEVETPPEGDYKGVVRRVRSEEKPIRVLPVPPNFDDGQWLVATGLEVAQNWSRNLSDVRVGDVLERRIRRTASGTVAELIPPVVWDSLPGVRLYPARSSVQNNKTRTAISASRSETIRYLFEEEGEVTLPALEFTWYHPYRDRLYKRTLPEVTLEVQANPDLGILASVRDSLAALQAREEQLEAEADAPRTIMGLSTRDFLLALALILLALYGLAYGLRRLVRYGKQRREAYRSSEAFFFHQFERSVKGKDRAATLRHLYRWIDELELEEPSLHYFLDRYGTPEGKKAWRANREASPGGLRKDDLHAWRQARKNYLAAVAAPDRVGTDHWINPRQPARVR